MVKTVKDYLEAVQEKFPFLCKDDIEAILDFGLRRYLQANRLHADVLIINRTKESMLVHCGRLGYDVLQHYKRWCTKWRMKERVLYKWGKQKWDGYYYIGLNEEQHRHIFRQSKKKTFTNVYLTKIKKELRHDKTIKHIWRIPYPLDCGYKFWIEKVITDKAEYVGENNYEKYHQCFLGRFEFRHSSVNNKEQSTD